MNKIGKSELDLLKEIYKDKTNYVKMIAKLENNYPVQYLIGYVDFLDLKIEVNEDVLIPRYETELLVDLTIKKLKNKDYTNLLDMGTGSGAIAISLKKYLNIEVDACDISEKALDKARGNAILNNASINFFKMDILNEELNKKYDVIISNPPYVKQDEYVSPETKYEPSIALYAKDNGLEFYKRILKLAKSSLNDNGLIVFEIGATLGEEIKKEALGYFPKANIDIIKDFNNFDRIMFIEI
ncbi:MAG: peptide chain release factor N(5)-glutamine methyltransferase [Ruminococcus sp.]|nr:peptide chain release factor N(5)-glutamine methyltransferase [Ruminococcus sp.]